eukprot:209058-Pelagomonas_calceolata.AAC.5
MPNPLLLLLLPPPPPPHTMCYAAGTRKGKGYIAVPACGAQITSLNKLGLDHQHAIRLACKLHAHSVMYAYKLVTTRRAIENTNTSHSQALEPGASSNPPDPL